ncbi:hypothetical protein Droror1_Dr00010083 [Drosera rotundifolia]
MNKSDRSHEKCNGCDGEFSTTEDDGDDDNNHDDGDDDKFNGIDAYVPEMGSGESERDATMAMRVAGCLGSEEWNACHRR